MHHPDSHHARSADEEPLTSIGARTQLPRRVRMLLEGTLSLCGGVLERVLTNTLDEFERQLFKDAERARNAGEQHDVFAALREVKRGRADIAPRFMQHLESSLAGLDQPSPATVAAQRPPPKRGELSLLDSSELEENISLKEIATKGEIRHSQSLYALGHRFGVLAASPLMDAETLPLGPHRLCDALRYALHCLGLKLEHRQSLYRLFDRQMTPELGVLYQAINDYLVEKHVLRYLQVIPHKVRSGSDHGNGNGQSDSHAANERSEAPPSAEGDAGGAGRHAPRDSGPSPYSRPIHVQAGQAPAMPMPSAAAISGGPASSGAAGSGGPASSGAAQGSPEASPTSTNDAELFTTLRELLAGRRAHIGGGAPTAPATGYMASSEDLQAVLGSLQNRPAAPMMLGGKLVQRSVGHLKQDMLAQLRQFAPDGRGARFGEEDGDTVDLVGLLFDHIAKDMRPNSSTQSLLTKLQVPVLRVALRDKSFFTRRNHPARQLLNTIAETGTYWADEGEGEADGALVEKMQLVVDRATGEFDGRTELFDELLGDLSRHMGTLARKAEVAERRHVDAAKGRERLDVARERAAADMAQHLTKGNPNRLVRALLEQAWTDVLALTYLRQGENSETYRRRLDVAEKLVTGREDNGVREELEQGLSQVGFLPDEIQTMVRQIVAPSESPTKDGASRTEMAMRLKANTRLGEDDSPQAPRGRQSTLQPPLSAEELVTLERLKTLPFGTWFEFTTNQQGERVRRKLAWFSTLTGRCLFVNQRGARSDERSLEQLARDVTRGQIRVATAEKESLIDRAWNAIMSTLRQFSGTPAAEAGT